MTKSLLDKLWEKAEYVEDMVKENPQSMAVYLGDVLDMIGVYPNSEPLKEAPNKLTSKDSK